MTKWIAALAALMLALMPAALAEEVATQQTPAADALTEGYEIVDNVLTIRLWDGPDTGCDWYFEIENEEVLTNTEANFTCVESSEPVPNMYGWRFAPNEDGEALIMFIYDSETDMDMESRMLFYTVEVEGGQIVDVLAEDLSDSEYGGDEDAGLLYKGETGGVELMIPEDMTASKTDEGMLLTSGDGLMTILIDYQKDDDPQELFEQLKDEQSAEEIYGGEDSDVEILACSVDMDGDVPCANLVLSTPDGIVAYEGYQAPEGGVLHVHTSYLTDDSDEFEEYELGDEDEYDFEDDDLTDDLEKDA